MASSCRQAACSKDGPALLTQEHEQPQHLVTSNTSNTNYAPTAHEETKSLPLKSINIQRHHLTIPSPTFVVCQRTAWRSCRSITLHHTCSTFKQYQLSEHRDTALIKYTKHLPPRTRGLSWMYQKNFCAVVSPQIRRPKHSLCSQTLTKSLRTSKKFFNWPLSGPLKVFLQTLQTLDVWNSSELVCTVHWKKT